MPDQERVAVEEALAAWRAADRELDETDADAPERPDRAARVATARAAYQRAVVAASGRIAEREEALSDDPAGLSASADERSVDQSPLAAR